MQGTHRLFRDRSKLALELIEGRPGITTREVAEELELPLISTYKLIADLWHQGQIRHYGDGWIHVLVAA